jgi:low affinity Fe/Cu permease
MEHRAPLREISKFLRRIGEATSRASAAVAVALVLLVFLLILGIEGFPTTWLTTFGAIADVVTLIMLFVIQHTQSRHQLVLQLKLDELIRSSPQADDRAVKLEVAPDEELIKREQEQLAHHESLREPEARSSINYKDQS